MGFLHAVPNVGLSPPLIGHDVDKTVGRFYRKINASQKQMRRSIQPHLCRLFSRQIVVSQTQIHRDGKPKHLGSAVYVFLTGRINHISTVQDKVYGAMRVHPRFQRCEQFGQSGGLRCLHGIAGRLYAPVRIR